MYAILFGVVIAAVVLFAAAICGNPAQQFVSRPAVVVAQEVPAAPAVAPTPAGQPAGINCPRTPAGFQDAIQAKPRTPDNLWRLISDNGQGVRFQYNVKATGPAVTYTVPDSWTVDDDTGGLGHKPGTTRKALVLTANCNP